MKRAVHFIPVLLMAGIFSSLTPAQALAREKISQVSLSFSMDTDTWNLGVDCGTEGYEVRTINLFPEGSGNSPHPYAVVVLDTTDNDLYFSSIKSSYFELDGEGAVFQEAARSNSNSTITVKVRLKDLGEKVLEAPTNLIWTDTGVASWEQVTGAGNYSVRIRRNGEAMGTSSAPTTPNTVYNLSTKITKTGTYVFQIKANGLFKKTKSSDWVSSPELVVDEAKLAYIMEHASQDTGVQGKWFQDDIGSWYQYTTGAIPRNEWREIDDAWYFFDSIGYKVTDQWVDRYYVGSDGKMLTNTITPDGNYVDENGALAPK